MAIAMPPSVIVLIVMPSSFMAKIATTSESGIATMEMAVARRFQRKTKRMITTKIAPSRSAATTLCTATVMKSACRKSRECTIMPFGSVFCMSTSSRSIRSVSSRVFAPGCFCTASTTPGFALTDPSPYLGAGPTRTSATCRSSTGMPPFTATTVAPMSSALCTRPSPRMTYSCPLSMYTPPDAFSFEPLAACSTCSSVTPVASMRAGSASTWYCFTSPPIGITCATPGTASSRRRIVQSAAVRSSCGDWVPVSPIMRISPITLDTGASSGAATPAGSELATLCSFSATICRARKMSVPHSNSTQTTEMPCAVDDRTRRMPVDPFTAVSMGNETSASTSSGAMPCASVSTVTVGAVRSGKTSTGMLYAVYAPATSMMAEMASTTTRFCSAQAMTLFSMDRSPSARDRARARR